MRNRGVIALWLPVVNPRSTHRVGAGTMLPKFEQDAIEDCYRRAAEARRIADAATDPDTKSDFLELERRWLFVAYGYETGANGPSWQV